MTSATPTRRERLRAATVDEIRSTARRLLVSDGPAAVTLRAIGREMGLTAPALYRYYPSLESLLASLCAALYHECVDYIEAQVAEFPEDDLAGRLATASRAFRTWSISHPAEFALMFASSGSRAKSDPGHEEAHAAAMRFAHVFFAGFVRLWQRAPFPVPDDDELPAELRAQIEPFLNEVNHVVPAAVLRVFVSSWIRLYGIVALEVFGYLHWAMEDVEPMFEAELTTICAGLGLTISPPASS